MDSFELGQGVGCDQRDLAAVQSGSVQRDGPLWGHQNYTLKEGSPLPQAGCM